MQGSLNFERTTVQGSSNPGAGVLKSAKATQTVDLVDDLPGFSALYKNMYKKD